MRRLALVAAALACTAAPTAHAGYLDPAVIATPGAGATLLGINDIGIAPDGTGALVYQQTVGGDDQVFASVLSGGDWGAPFRVDPDDGDDESSPRVAVGNGGRVLIGYRDGNAQFLRYRLKQAGASPLEPESVMRDAGAAARIQADWDLDMNPDGVAYAAWADKNPVTTRNDARAWRLDSAGSAQLIPDALQQDPTNQGVNDGGNGPDIRVAVDAAGNGTVMFGQTTDLTFARRLVGTAPSATFVPVDVPSVLGETRSTAERQLDLDVAGNGLAWATGTAMYTAGGHAVGVPVVGETPGAPAILDAYPASENDNIERPDVSLNATGQGLFASEPNLKPGVFGGSIDGSAAAPAVRLETTPHDPTSEVPVAAIGDSGTGLVAWTRDVENSGGNGPFELRGRRWNGSAFEDETLMASDAKTTFPLGQANGAGASRLGDVAVLAEREVTGTKSVIVARFDAPPTAPTITSAANATTFTWAASEAIWSPVASYTVIIDEATVATLGPGELTYTATGLAPGAHTWRIVAADTLGQQAASPTQTLTVPEAEDPDPPPDTTPPVISNLSQSKKRWRVGRGTRFRLTISETSTLTIALTRLRPGRRLKSGRCVKPRRTLRKRPRCVRPKRVGLVQVSVRTGQVTIRFSGRLNGKALAAGRYVARFSARDAAGNRSATRKLRFRVVRG